MSSTARAAFVKVWDPFVRVFHWLVAAGFVVAYVSEGEPMWLHSWTGYLIAVLLLLRLVWGFVGPRTARFVDFVYKPGTVVSYLLRMPVGRAKRYLGHSPAGGAMVIALMLCLAGTAGTGMALHAVRNNAGPLAGIIKAPPAEQIAPSAGDDRSRSRPRKPGRELKEVHEVLANLTLVLVFLHIGGVLIASLSHRENLVRAMIDGRKRPLSD